MTKTPNQASYAQGESVTLQATPDPGYQFVGWSGDLSGSTNPVALVMNSNKSVTANFAAQSYALAVAAVHGSVTKTPNQASYTAGESVTLQATPDPGYQFVGWSGDASGTGSPITIMMDSDKTVVANFAGEVADQSPPVLADCSPTPDSIQVPPNTLVSLHLRDEGAGIDATSVSIRVQDNLVYTGDTDSHGTAYGVCHRTGPKADYTYTYQQREIFDCSREILVTVNARDLAGNVMPEQTYSFATEMYSFRLNRSVSVDQTSLDQGRPATVGDGRGNAWVVWHAGIPGSRHVYAARFLSDADTYGSAVQVSPSAGDHCNPAVAIDSRGTLLVVWQENASAVWDVCMSTSFDGDTWSSPRRIVDAGNNQAGAVVNRVNPAIAAGRQPTGLVAVAWQEDRAGNQDIYVAGSRDTFFAATISQVTSDSFDQSDPAIAVACEDVISVVWTDARNGSTDIYGAASDSGPWMNVPVVNGVANQSYPAIVAGSVPPILHMVWLDDGAGNLDVIYASWEDLPAVPVEGISIIDDTTGADQQAPAIAVATGLDGTDKIFACWQDGRNVAYSGDTDLYFADVSPGSLWTNVLVGDDGAGCDQADVALSADACGYPYLVWADSRAKNAQVYFSGATYANPVPLAVEEISLSVGGVVGTPREQITALDDVSVAVPAQAGSLDVTISIARIMNPQDPASESLRSYDFGPSGLQFTRPVTITIPYGIRRTGKLRAYWYDATIGVFSDQGVTDIEDIAVAPGLHALRFKTTHFTPFYLVDVTEMGTADGSGGSGGGCSLAARGEGNPVGYFIPYLLLILIMAVIRLRDARS